MSASAVRTEAPGGAFVSDYTIDATTLEVRKGADLADAYWFWDDTAGYEQRTGSDANLNRFCSADLAAKSAFWDPDTRTGYNGRIFMNGEEAAEGRAFAHLVTGREHGTAWELPALGNFAWENALAAPGAGRATVVVGTDDVNPPRRGLRVHRRQAAGRHADRARRPERGVAVRDQGRGRSQREPNAGHQRREPALLAPRLRGRDGLDRRGPSGGVHRQRGDHLPPARGRRMGSDAPERLLLRHDRSLRHDGRRQLAPVAASVPGRGQPGRGRHDRGRRRGHGPAPDRWTTSRSTGRGTS